MRVASKTEELLEYVRPFRLGSGRLPTARELRTIECLASDLEKENPTPKLKDSFGRVAGMWECVFTSSQFVLGLDRIPFVRLSAAYQRVIVDAAGETGHYFNIAELSRGSAVECLCGEYASIRPSALDDARMDVQYEWFYFTWRVWRAYAGHIEFADELETGRERGDLRLPFHGRGWQSTVYLSDRLRIVRGNQGGIFVMARR